MISRRKRFGSPSFFFPFFVSDLDDACDGSDLSLLLSKFEKKACGFGWWTRLCLFLVDEHSRSVSFDRWFTSLVLVDEHSWCSWYVHPIFHGFDLIILEREMELCLCNKGCSCNDWFDLWLSLWRATVHLILFISGN